MAAIDPRLRADLRSDLGKLQELLTKADSDAGAQGTLDKLQIHSAINECAVIAAKTAIIQVALESADTDGTGAKINVSRTLQRLSEDLLKEQDSEHVAAARDALKDKRGDLVAQTDARGAHGFVEAHALRIMFTAAPFSLSGDVVSSMLRFFGVKDEAGDSVRVPEIMRSFCPMLDQAIFAALNAKLVEKYASVKTAFDALSKNGKISRHQLSELLAELPLDLKLQPNEVTDLVCLADADNSGAIEYQEFQIIFSTSEMLARARQENYKKMQAKAAVTATVRSDSIQASTQAAVSSSLTTRNLSPEERVAEVLLGPRHSELAAALKEADSKGNGSIDPHTLQGAFNKLGLGLSADDLTALLTKVSILVCLRVCLCLYLCLYLCICVCVCVCTCLCIHIYTYVYLYIHAYIYVYIYKHICIHVNIYVYIYMYICTYIYIYTYTYMYMYAYIHMYIYECIDTYTNTYIYIYIS